VSVNPIDFEMPLWSATIYHSERGADNPWNRVFNSSRTTDQTLDNELALHRAVALFEGDGLNPVTIYRIEVAPLLPFTDEGGGEDAGSGSLE
jgi:hypothetical protein